MEIVNNFILWFNYGVLVYYGFANGVYLLLLVLASGVVFGHLRRLIYGGYQEHIHPSVAPPVSVIIACYNEERNIVETVRSLMGLNYPAYEVIVVNDGSTDSTLERMKEGFGLKPMDLVYRPIIPTSDVNGFYVNPEIPNLTLIDKVHGGKADSLNVGINASRSPYFCSVDADSILETDALTRLMRPVVENPELVKASGGIVRIINGCTVKDGRIEKVALPKESLPRLQVVEYIRSFLFGRAGWSAINSLLIISGTFSMFHKRTVQALGGYSSRTVTEDMDLVVSLHRHLMDRGERYRILFVPYPICWTEVPGNLRMLARQRRRWHMGLAQSLYHNIGMLFNPRYGRIGLFAMPYQVLIELLGPVVEVGGYFVVAGSFMAGIVDVKFLVLFITLAVLIGVLLSTGAILLEELTYRRYPSLRDLFVLLIYGVLENFGYRQMNSLWRTEALLRTLLSRRGWEHVHKEGFNTHKRTGESGA